MLSTARQLPKARQDSAMKQIRDGFRKHRNAKGEQTISELLEDATKRLKFMYTLIPKHKRPDFAVAPQAGRGRFVVREGQVLDGKAAMTEKARWTNWMEGNMDPDSVARHEHLMRRFRFQDRPGGPPSGPTWHVDPEPYEQEQD